MWGAAGSVVETTFRFCPSGGVQKKFLSADGSGLSNNGDAHIDYESNQADPATSPASASCTQLPQRTPGDVIISFDTQFGGKIINVSAATWNGSSFSPLSLGSQRVLWDGAVNTVGSSAGLTATGTNHF